MVGHRQQVARAPPRRATSSSVRCVAWTAVNVVSSAPALLQAATASGYACLGWPAGGRIAPGALADLTTVGLRSVRLAGTAPEDALAATVFAGAAPDVTDVHVGGRRIVRAGAHVRLDVARELHDAVRAVTA